ncbi:GNAT family N-acetyltransferase [Salisediminibacterium selenitireducens]|uniref:GCN5-related N-acetyltransferase n=1 Tax=Bacillus selenitireducens (strain ATCC 700615 / DSM 15326 / MLS10) TaxID=439292 RepID=D6XT96_BACIE|nr:GNAT family N-acetyltransferase [Salisediminibacterium selenitireducens]ADH99032.1 GCN5-related N-acetyltransferase [[Bacillus] selenitireducens MLS10]
MHIRHVEKPGTLDEINGITNLMMERIHTLSTDTSEITMHKTVSQALTPGTRSDFFIAVNSEGTIIGAIFLNRNIGLDHGGEYIWLNELYVRKDHRKQGIARKMLMAVVHWAENEGYKAIELETGMNNEATKKLYNSLGFYDVISKRYSRALC